MQTSNSIKSIFNFNILSGFQSGYFNRYLLNGRKGELDMIDYFTSNPDFDSCCLGIQLYEDTPTHIDIWFSNKFSKPRPETNHVKLTFEVTSNGKLAYTDGLIVFLIDKTTLQLCVMNKPYSPNELDYNAFEGEVKQLLVGLEAVKPVEVIPDFYNLRKIDQELNTIFSEAK